MKISLSLCYAIISTIMVYAQDIKQLEKDSSFKGITIGMPITAISNKIRYEKTVNGYILYKVIDTQYYSVFNVKMNYEL